jgi:hypothetical protein
MQGRMPLLAEAQIRPGAQYPYALHTESCNARGGGTRRLVPKSQVECRFQEAWYDLPPKPKTHARARRGVVPLVTSYPQSREPNPGHTPERWLKSRSEAVRSGVGRFLGLDAPLPRPSPAAHCRDPPQFLGVWGELNPVPRSPPAGLSFTGPGGPASSSRPFGPITIR